MPPPDIQRFGYEVRSRERMCNSHIQTKEDKNLAFIFPDSGGR